MASNIPCISCNYDPTLKITGSWLIELPYPAPSGNQTKSNQRGWGGETYRRLRDQFYECIRGQCKNIPSAHDKRRVFFTRFYRPPARPYDQDNLATGMKGLRDGLKKLELVVDDSPKWMESHYRQVLSDSNCMSIQLEDILWP